jgi:oleandomycin transport system permease protein
MSESTLTIEATQSTTPPSRSTRVTSNSTATTTSRVPRGLRHALVMAKRNLIKTMRTPEQLIDVTAQPVIFLLLFTYVFGGAIGHGSHAQYLEYLLPGLLGQSIAMGSVALGQNLNADHRERRLRPVPVAADREIDAAGGRRRR